LALITAVKGGHAKSLNTVFNMTHSLLQWSRLIILEECKLWATLCQFSISQYSTNTAHRTHSTIFTSAEKRS